jgi:hypothetical protein
LATAITRPQPSLFLCVGIHEENLYELKMDTHEEMIRRVVDMGTRTETLFVTVHVLL